MTKNAVIDVVHKTIYGFFDVTADDSEEPISEKDKLLLEVNKTVCNAIKAMPDEERKTGRWRTRSRKILSTRNDRFYWRECSACRWCREDCNTANDTTYCPNCGAEMKGGAE